MKIAYLLPVDGSILVDRPNYGPCVHIRRVVEELQCLGHQVLFITWIGSVACQSTDLVHFQPISVPWLDAAPCRWVERILRAVQWRLRLPYLAFFDGVRFGMACRQAASDTDVFYERHVWLRYGGAIASRSTHRPLVLEINGDDLFELEVLGLAPTGLQRRLQLAFVRRAVRSASRWVASGSAIRRRFIERWQLPSELVTVVPNGTDMVDLVTPTWPAAGSSPGTPLVLLYAGGFETWHGLDVLLDAFAKARAAEIPMRLILVGDGPRSAEVRKTIAALGIGDFVDLPGYAGPTEYAALLSNADIGVSPYCHWMEYDGMKLLDYKAAGLATIASGEQGSPTLITHGRTGLIVPPCDVDALRDAIVRLATDRALMQQFGECARIEAIERHSWRATAQQIESILLRVVNQSA